MVPMSRHRLPLVLGVCAPPSAPATQARAPHVKKHFPFTQVWLKSFADLGGQRVQGEPRGPEHSVPRQHAD